MNVASRIAEAKVGRWRLVDLVKCRAVEALLNRIGDLDFDGAADLLHPNAVMTFPYMPQIPDAHGRDNVIAQIRATMPHVLESMSFVFESFVGDDAGTRIVTEYRSHCPKRAGGVYENRYVGVFDFVDDKIILYKEYFDPTKLGDYQSLIGAT